MLRRLVLAAALLAGLLATTTTASAAYRAGPPCRAPAPAACFAPAPHLPVLAYEPPEPWSAFAPVYYRAVARKAAYDRAAAQAADARSGPAFLYGVPVPPAGGGGCN